MEPQWLLRTKKDNIEITKNFNWQQNGAMSEPLILTNYPLRVIIALDSAIKQENTVRLSKKIVWKKSANKQQNNANKHAERLPVVVLHLLHPAVVLFVALVGFLAELSPEVGSLPETGHGRFGKSLLQIRIVSYH